MRKKLGIGLAAVLVVLLGLTLALKLGAFAGILPESEDVTRATLTQTSAKLAKAGTARITFTGGIKPQVAGLSANWSGTTQISFSDNPSWESTYDKVEVPGGKSVQATVLHKGSQTLVSSPALAIQDGRTWVNTRTTPMLWQHPLATPSLGITDFTMWEQILDTITPYGAHDAKTDELPDVKGADHEYYVTCTRVSGSCPPPFGSHDLDYLFNNVGRQLRLSAWYDDDGLLRRLDVDGSVAWNSALAGGQDPIPNSHPDGEYYYEASFTLDSFGSPVTITMPPDSQVTQSPGVTLRS